MFVGFRFGFPKKNLIEIRLYGFSKFKLQIIHISYDTLKKVKQSCCVTLFYPTNHRLWSKGRSLAGLITVHQKLSCMHSNSSLNFIIKKEKKKHGKSTTRFKVLYKRAIGVRIINSNLHFIFIIIVTHFEYFTFLIKRVPNF